jgi:glutamyl-tRNA(Gln) amidotransferase subunit E
VQRGIGSIRQDVNLSIREGARVEIKGFQDISVMDRIIENEVERQINLVLIKKELIKRGAKVHQAMDVTAIFNSTAAGVIGHNIKNDGDVLASRLEGFAGVMGKEINPDRRLGSEISDYAKVGGIKGIVHSDEDLGSYSMSVQEVESLKRKLGVKEGDAFMLIAGPKSEVKKSMERAMIRADYAIKGVPLETRVVDSERQTTRFLRPLPGGSRMYPETDAKPIELSAERYEKLKEHVPDVRAITAKLEKEIGNKQIAEQMLRSTYLKTYNSIISKVKVDPKFVAAFLLEKLKDLRRSGFDVDSVSEEVLECVFEKLVQGRITKAAVEEIVKSTPKNPEEVDRIIEGKNMGRITGEKLKKLIANFDEKDKNLLIKKIMSKYRLNIDGEELNAVLK